MEYDQERSMVPIGTILFGTLVALVVNLILTILFTVLTELGWTASVESYGNNLFLFMGYLAVITGAIVAGRESLSKGWLAGLGVGITGSIIFLILNSLMGHSPVWGFFLVKTLVNGFIGAFGGIIGINLAGSQK